MRTPPHVFRSGEPRTRFGLTGRVLDIEPAAGAPGMRLWFRTADGATVALFAPFRPSFAVSGPHVRGTAVAEAARRWGCPARRVERIEFFSGRPVPAWIFTVPSPSLLGPVVRRAERAFGPDALHDADIAPEQQFAFSTGLHPLALARIECDPEGLLLSAEVLDNPWDPDAATPTFPTAFLRVQGTGHPAHGPVRPLEFAFDGETHVLEWDGGPSFLRELSRLLACADPDLIVTEYGDDYILPRLLALARACRTPLSLGREPRAPGGLPGGPGVPAPDAGAVRRARERSYFSYGQVVFRAAAHTLSGRWHVDARNSFLYADTGLPGLAELSRLSGIPLQRMARSSPGTAISAMEVARALSRGILVPYRKREPESFKSGAELVTADKGGLTFLPRPGLHGNVAELDFASMYPSLMERHNISPETVDCACCDPGLPVPEIGARTCRRRRGLVPDVLAPILEKRRRLKERQKGAADGAEREHCRKRQAALKWLLVVSFGFLGYRNARFGKIEAHEAVTAWGREMLLSAKDVAEREGYRFLHGLTDAIWVAREATRNEGGGADGEAGFRALADRITEETGMPIALEGVYRWIAFLPSRRNRSVAVPNRFVGAFADGEVKARGILSRRSDTPPFVAAFQRELLRRMASARDVAGLRAMRPELDGMLEEAVARLRSGAVPPEALSVSRRLSKAPEDYVADTAAAKATRELCGRGVPLRPGSRIRYLLTEEGKGCPRLPAKSPGGETARGGEQAVRKAGGSAPRPAGRPGGRILGFLDGSEVPDLSRYEAMLREAAEEVVGPIGSLPGNRPLR